MSEANSKKRKQQSFDDLPPGKKRKSVSFATAVHYFEDDLDKEKKDEENISTVPNEVLKDTNIKTNSNTNQNGEQSEIKDFSVEEITLGMKMSEGVTVERTSSKDVSLSEATESNNNELISTHQDKGTVSAMEQEERIDFEAMDFTETIPPIEQFNDEMEMTEVLPVKENLTDAIKSADSSKSLDEVAKDMQFTEEVNTGVHRSEDKNDDYEFLKAFSNDEPLEETEKVEDLPLNGDASLELTSSISKKNEIQNDTISTILDGFKVKQNSTSASNHGDKANTVVSGSMLTTSKPNEDTFQDTASLHNQLQADKNVKGRSEIRSSITSFNDSRLSNLHDTQSITIRNLTVEEFLRATNIRLGLSATYGMKPRTSMYIPSDNDQQPLTYEEKVHLQSVTPIYHSVIQAACVDLKKKSLDAERQLNQLTHQINQNNPPIFKYVQSLTHGSNEYRTLRQQLTNLKSYARAKNRFEFVKWKIEVEKKKHLLIHDERKKLQEDQHAIENEIKNVKLQTIALEEEFDRLQKMKGRLQRKLDKSFHSDIPGSKPSQAQTLGFMEMMTRNIHTEVIPPNRCRLSYPSLNFSLDIIFSLSEKGESPISRYESTTRHFNPSIAKGMNPYKEFCSHTLEMIPIQKIFEGAKKAAEFRSVFSAKLHPLLNRLHRILTSIIEYRKKNPIIQFQFPEQSQELKDQSLVKFRLVFIHHRRIIRIVTEYTISTHSMLLSAEPQIIETYPEDASMISQLKSNQFQSYERSFKFERLEKSMDCILQYLYSTEGEPKLS